MRAFSDADRASADAHLAVYGTLAPGRANHWMLASLGGTWTEGTVLGRRVAAGWGNDHGYPALVLDDEGDEISVALLTSEALADRWPELDAFEGAEYERVIAEVRTDCIVLANIYVLR